jgi:leucyl/phenylalanyl-tRNA--protein transferase
MQLSPNLLLQAYSQGIFPMADEDGTIGWYEPKIRAVIPIDERFHVPRRLARVIRKGIFEVRYDTAFEAVIRACAVTEPGRESTWISREIIAAYEELHRQGHAHSVECWRDEQLVGGLYGVALQGPLRR